jgi:hypothetical protein
MRIFEPVLKNPKELLSGGFCFFLGGGGCCVCAQARVNEAQAARWSHDKQHASLTHQHRIHAPNLPGAHTRSISVATPSSASGGIMRFAKVGAGRGRRFLLLLPLSPHLSFLLSLSQPSTNFNLLLLTPNLPPHLPPSIPTGQAHVPLLPRPHHRRQQQQRQGRRRQLHGLVPLLPLRPQGAGDVRAQPGGGQLPGAAVWWVLFGFGFCFGFGFGLVLVGFGRVGGLRWSGPASGVVGRFRLDIDT